MKTMTSALILLPVLLASCFSAQLSPKTVSISDHAGQREIHRGMTQSEVAETLGDPSVVSRDGSNNERWIYEEFATKASYSKEIEGKTPISGSDSNNGPQLMVYVSPDAGKPIENIEQQKQRPISVVIKYDSEGRVDTATFHTTNF